MTKGPVQLDVGVSYGLPRKGLPSAASFRKWAAAAAEGRIRRADLAIRLVDAKEGRALNRHYRGKDYATNVLSFPADLPEGVDLPLLGDLVIATGVATRQAREAGHPLQTELRVLALHGLLHLLGYDHEDPADNGRMARAESRLRRRSGLTAGLIQRARGPR